MLFSARAAAVSALALLAAAQPSLAQGPDADVLPRGVLSIGAGGVTEQFGALYDKNGERVLLGNPIAGRLDATSFPLATAFRQTLGDFFAAAAPLAGEEPFVIPAGQPVFGDVDVRGTAVTTRVPLSVALGLGARFEARLMLPVERYDIEVGRFGLRGGLVGANPDVAGNAALLAGIDSTLLAFGNSGLLPLQSSPLGRELQRLVLALSGGTDSLSLPALALSRSELAARSGAGAILTDPLENSVGEWKAGDVLAQLSFQFLNTAGGYPFPADIESGQLHLRSVAAVGARLAVTSGAEAAPGLLAPPEQRGSSGFTAAVSNDVFFGRRFWGNVSAGVATFGTRSLQVAVLEPGELFPKTTQLRTVEQTPGTQISLTAAPRYRLTPEISLGLLYHLQRSGDQELRISGDVGSGAGATTLRLSPAGNAQRVGGGFRYASIRAGESWPALPVDLSITYLRTITGSDGAPAAGMLEIRGEALLRLWGRR